MDTRQFISFMNTIETLKCNTRHSWTSSGRQESVAEHSWRLAVMAMLCRDEYPDLDLDKVMRMCLIHDWGEAVTGDIPAFLKTGADEAREDEAITQLLTGLPEAQRGQCEALFAEMAARETPEAKLFKALDNLEALLSHNEADIATWLPLEYENNLTYGRENVAWSPWTRALKADIDRDTKEKIRQAKE